jgi:hypothetical protein
MVLAEESREEPGLALAAVLALPQLADQRIGQVVEELFGRLGDDGDVLFAQPRLLAQLAQRSDAQVLALVDAALRHLPGVTFLVVDPLADEGVTIAVDQHDPHAGAIGQRRDVDHSRAAVA